MNILSYIRQLKTKTEPSAVTKATKALILTVGFLVCLTVGVIAWPKYSWAVAECYETQQLCQAAGCMYCQSNNYCSTNPPGFPIACTSSTAPSAPTPLSPNNGTWLNSSSVLLKWGFAGATPDGTPEYYLRVKAPSGVFIFNQSVGTATSYTINLNQQGEYYWQALVRLNNGHWSAPSESIFKRETQSPDAFSCSLNPNPPNWTNSQVTATGTFTDSGGSGLATTQSCTVSQNGSCTSTASDNAGNVGTVDCIIQNIDKIYPYLNSFTVSGSNIKNTKPVFTWSASDGQSGIRPTNGIELWRARFDNNNCNGQTMTGCVWSQGSVFAGSTTSGTDMTINDEGKYLYGVHIIDAVGNCITEGGRDCTTGTSISGRVGLAPLLFTYDLTPPQTTDSWTDVWTTSSLVTVNLSATDNLSSVATTKYCVDSGEPCTPTTASTSATFTCQSGQTCFNYLRYYSTDTAGNNESVKIKPVRIDKQGPKAPLNLTITACNPPNATDTCFPFNKGNFTLAWTPPLDDYNGSGVSSNYVVFLNSPLSVTGTQANISLPQGSYNVQVCNYDNVGNLGQCGLGSETIVDTTYPTLTPTFRVKFPASTAKPILEWGTMTDNGGSELYRLELWRTTDIDGMPNQGGWQMQTTSTITTSSWTDQSAVGGTKYYYGFHLLDKAGNCLTERGKDCATGVSIPGAIDYGLVFGVQDTTLPNATINYTTPWNKTGTISVTYSATDSESGITQMYVEQATATLSAGTCGIYSAYTQVANTLMASGQSTTKTITVTHANCYKFKTIALNGTGNQGQTTGSDLKVDTQAPTVTPLTINPNTPPNRNWTTTITSPTTGFTTSNQPTIQVSYSDPVSGVVVGVPLLKYKSATDPQPFDQLCNPDIYDYFEQCVKDSSKISFKVKWMPWVDNSNGIIYFPLTFIKDQAGNIASGTINVEIRNQAPVAVPAP